jgi:SnoaL-like domain
MRGIGAADRIQRFLGWLDAFGSALERNDLAALDALFALEASYRPTPFMPVVRGRRKIRDHIGSQIAERRSLAVTARALGVGSTYAIAHWAAAWQTAGGADAVEDAVLLAAFDPFGRCTSLRVWSVLGDQPTEPPLSA